MYIIKYLLLSIIFISFNAKSSFKVVEIDGVLDTNKKKLLKNESSEHLSLYGILPCEGIEDSSYFKNRNLIVSCKTINPEIISLRLQMCGLKDENITQIGDFTKLKKLELPANAITDQGVEYIKNLSQLEYLNLNKNQITDRGVKSIAQMFNLKHLNLSLNERITDEGIDYLKNISSLEKLVIRSTFISYRKYKEISKWGNLNVRYYPLN